MKSVFKLNYNNDTRRFIAEFENLDALKRRVEDCYHLEKDSFLIKQKGKIINEVQFNKIISTLEIPIKFEIELKSEKLVNKDSFKEKPEDLKNLQVILSFFSENISKENLINLIVGITKSIPKEQLTCILKSLLSSPQLQEILIESILSLINNLQLNEKEEISTFQNQKEEQSEEHNENFEETFEITEEELNQIDDTKQGKYFQSTKNYDELDDLMKELLDKQSIIDDEEDEEDEILDQWNRLEELVLQEHHFSLEEEIKGEENLNDQQNEQIEKQKEQQDQQDQQDQQEKERLREEELNRQKEEQEKLIEEQMKEEKERKEQEEQMKEELKRQKEEKEREEEERKKELKRKEEEQLVQIVLENNEISFQVFELLKELGCVESHGYEPILSLILKHKGNIEQVANEIFP